MYTGYWADAWLTPNRAVERDERRRVSSHLILVSLYFAAAAGAAIIVAFVILNAATTTTCLRPPIRREWRSLGKDEKEEYISAAKCLYNVSSQVVSEGSVQDDFAWIHIRYSGAAHEDASFLPWHRMFVHIYEQKLRDHCGLVGQLPYWDWSRDWQNLTTSSIWDDTDGFGSPGTGESSGISGPFSDVHVRYRDNGTISPHRLARSFLNYDSGEIGSMSGELIKPEIMGRLARAGDYDTFRYLIEGTLHNVVHLEVVGDLDELTAPNGMFRKLHVRRCNADGVITDPIFWLHHVQLDRLWWQWQQEDQTRVWEYYGEHEKQTSRRASLQDELSFGDLISRNILVEQVMDTQSSMLCYRY
ncbi:hypothetical protein F5Y14DRAFT_5294 [Nemania sp. NC0429]|nr:hypothetical protein F5Y14DRAFT_5294 [Nemania sp. NC0429]